MMLLVHAGRPDGLHDLWTAWSLDPVVLMCLGLTGWAYLRGAASARRVSGRAIPKWERRAFLAGWLALVIALVSPIHELGEVLFSAHMTQHEVLMLVAAPLLVLGRPLVPFLWALPMNWRQGAGEFAKQPAIHWIWQRITNPLTAWCIHAAALWAWHAPFLFDATLRSDIVHTAQHISFLGTALLFWWSLIHGGPGLMGYGAAVLYVFTTSLHTSVLGALITFSQSVWYSSYATSTSSWGLTPLEDQQIGGLIMWVPAALVYIVAALALVTGWMRESERRTHRRENQHLRNWANRTLFVLSILIGSTTSACSTRMSQTDLRSSAAEIVSIASEGQLFLKFVSDGHATREYTAAHPEYLNKQSESIAEQLYKAEPGPEVDPSRLQQLRVLAARLGQATTRLQQEPTNSALNGDFAAIAEEARRVGLSP